MNRLKKSVCNNRGVAIIYVMIVISVIALLSTISVKRLQHDSDAVAYQQMNAKCYYLAKGVAECCKQVLIDKDTKKTKEFSNFSVKTSEINHTSNGETSGEPLGTTKLKLTEIEIGEDTDKEKYLVVYMKTTIEDQVNVGEEYTMYYEFRISEKNSYVQVFDIITEDKTV